MGFLERAIRRGVSDAVGKAIGKAIEPTVTDLTNKAANAIDQAAQNTEQQVARSSGLEGAMVFYILSFAQMALPISAAAKGVLWFVLFGMAKTTQYAGLGK